MAASSAAKQQLETVERGVDAFLTQASKLAQAGEHDKARRQLDKALRLAHRQLGEGHHNRRRVGSVRHIARGAKVAV